MLFEFNMLKHLLQLYFCILFIYPSCINAQLYAPGADYSDQVSYDSPGSTDSIHVFNAPSYGGSANAMLEALSPDRTDNWQFLWSIYNPVTGYFVPSDTFTGSSSYVYNIDTSAGYQVIFMKNEAVDTSRAWILINDFNVEITTKDDSGKLPSLYYSCDYIDMEAKVAGNDLYYYIPCRTDTIIYVSNNYSDIEWTAENEEGSGSHPSGVLDPRISNPPYEDTEYTITIIDRFNCERSDAVLYESIQSKAEFDNSYIPLTDSKYYPEEYGLFYGGDYDKKSAPAKYKFFNTDSRNAATYFLKFGNGDDTTFYSGSDTVIYEYIFPGNYTATLITKSARPYECLDSSSIEITIDEPSMGSYAGGDETGEPPLLPNVFTPNLDGFSDVFRQYQEEGAGSIAVDYGNDLFRSADVSIYDIEIIIFNRYGRKVHSYKGNIRDWKGWDGKIMNSDKNASEGVYFYVIRKINAVESWENPKLINYKKNVRSGCIHLFREP
jgi:hypothetical protein